MAYERKTYDIFISDDLKEILTQFESESVVAQLLLKKRHDKEELVDNPVNFISISREDRTKLSYLTIERMETLSPTEYWTSSRRFQAKPGGFISKVFKNVNSREVEKFSNLFRSQVNKPRFNFSIVKGPTIRNYYHYDSYQADKGTLGASCMKHESCQKYLDLYVYNPDVVSMLIMTDDYGGLMGRALLWKFESHKIMDRIYTVCDEELMFYFKQWATQNGFLYKSEQNWYNTMQFEQVGQKRQELKLEISINTDFRYLPYMDTFKFLDAKTGKLYNYQYDSRHLRTLCSSEGSSYEGDYLRFDGIDRVLRYQGDSAWVDYKEFYTHYNNITWSEVNGQYILNEHVEYCNEIGEPIFNSKYDHLNNHELIEKRKKELEEWNKKRPKKLSGLSVEQLLEKNLISQEDIEEIFGNINFHRTSNQNQ
jgi:hypothetical protein